jgi:hypothetical protein
MGVGVGEGWGVGGRGEGTLVWAVVVSTMVGEASVAVSLGIDPLQADSNKMMARVRKPQKRKGRKIDDESMKPGIFSWLLDFLGSG